MAKINPQKFIVEQFPDQASWIGSLFSSLNSFINEVFLAFQNKLTVEDNLFQEIKEVKFSYTANNLPVRFRTKFNIFPKGMILIYAYNDTDSSAPTTQPWPQWVFQNGEIIINDFDGLTSGKTYIMKFLVIYG